MVVAKQVHSLVDEVFARSRVSLLAYGWSQVHRAATATQIGQIIGPLGSDDVCAMDPEYNMS
jgi:hypothetical protein